MQRHHSQFGRRKNAASPRRLALRHVTHDIPQSFVQQSAVGPNNSTETQERPPAESPSIATDVAVLDVASLRSLHQMFLLLDEWDSEIASRTSSTRNLRKDAKSSLTEKLAERMVSKSRPAR
jgi:hypothetical protein